MKPTPRALAARPAPTLCLLSQTWNPSPLHSIDGAQEIIESLMLANSSYDHRIPTSSLGLQCWKEAMDLRFSGEPLLPKTPHVYVQSSASNKVFGSMQELASGAEFTTFFDEYQRRCVDGDVDDLRMHFENTLKLQSLLVTRRICSAANRVVYIGSVFDVAEDLWKPSPIQDNQQFIDLCWVIVEEVMGQHTFSEELLLILTATFVSIASFFYRTSFELELNDHGNEEQWDVECCSNFAELVMHFLVVLKTISPMLPIQNSHTLKSFYSEFIRSW
ncbi:hypothetical protein DAPPUDRAFT_238807 [Daphnia pulex]|uniref:Uncharacterized protein n=1 Tax=Daphnia pulex TaxID=6669 RepID=E9G7G2_DAPPU|nr:hypothetical protein DAPPUDRAFT_238807 [Daphnia pulex]|eukprot:EFX84647.1 hypothetical protein DAPPUDRAFT_238807 [Daphnia pulex]